MDTGKGKLVTFNGDKKAIAENTQVNRLKELLYAMQDALYKWWCKQGFDLVIDDAFGSYGYKGKFCLGISFLSIRPESWLEQMIEGGYEFTKEYRSYYFLLDTPKNRELITKFVKSKFQSIEITKWENRNLRKTEQFTLRSFECYIRDLNELKALIDEMKQASEKED